MRSPKRLEKLLSKVTGLERDEKHCVESKTPWSRVYSPLTVGRKIAKANYKNPERGMGAKKVLLSPPQPQLEPNLILNYVSSLNILRLTRKQINVG